MEDSGNRVMYYLKDGSDRAFVSEGARSKFWGVSGSEDRGGVTTVSNLLILGGWVTKVLKNCDEKWGGGGRVGDNNILTFLCYWLDKKATF